MTIYLLRHGQTDWNKLDRCQGRTDIPLNEYGVAQAFEIAKYFDNLKINKIYSSTLKRSIKTAEIIKRKHPEAKFISLEDLVEINFGILEGMTTEEISFKYPEVIEARNLNKFYFKAIDGESYQEVFNRVSNFTNTIKEDSGNIVVIGHKAINRCILMHILEKSEEWAVNLDIPNDGIYEVNIDTKESYTIINGNKLLGII